MDHNYVELRVNEDSTSEKNNKQTQPQVCVVSFHDLKNFIYSI